MAMPDIPMYVFTGFLESGKTKFIQETLEDERFHKGERTLLLPKSAPLGAVARAASTSAWVCVKWSLRSGVL